MPDTLRIATSHDAATIAALVNDAYRPGPTSGGWTHEAMLVDGDRTDTGQIAALIARTDGALLVGCRRDAIVACVDLRQHDEHIAIGLLAVAPALQNTGVGKAMLAHAETYAVQHFKPHRLVMQVIGERAELMAFYTRRGYAPNGRVTAYPNNSGIGQAKTELRIIELHKLAEPAALAG